MKGIVNSQFNFEIKDGEDWDIVKTKDGLFNIIYKEKSFIANVLSHDKKNKVFEIVINNNHYKVQLKDSFDEALIRLGVEHQEVDKDKAVVSPMPGKVVEVFVGAGDSVDEGDSLIVLEGRGYPRSTAKYYFNHNHHRYFSINSFELIFEIVFENSFETFFEIDCYLF